MNIKKPDFSEKETVKSLFQKNFLEQKSTLALSPYQAENVCQKKERQAIQSMSTLIL